ncbi:MAG: thioesterase domain-containing protein [Candidatus Paracaedibacteraceae bacterium]|nr:thioesterase domain-containing protein [Candidatus Paracaedibacteraceae bacterium]
MADSLTQLETYLYEHIPLSVALGVKAVEASCHQVVLTAPMTPNINHKQTAFGGSLHAVATLACWSLMYLNLKEFPHFTDIVISKSEVNYICPVTTDFTVECSIENQSDWLKVESILYKKGIGRLRLNAKIYQDGKLAVDYWGEFVAIRRKK